MCKFLIISTGLLVLSGNAFAVCTDPDPYSSGNWDGCTTGPQGTEERYAREKQQRDQEENRRPRPTIVDGPGGAQLYYPNSDGTYWTTYGR